MKHLNEKSEKKLKSPSIWAKRQSIWWTFNCMKHRADLCWGGTGVSERFARTLRDGRGSGRLAAGNMWRSSLSVPLELGLNRTSFVLCVLLGQVHTRWVFTRNCRREGTWVEEWAGEVPLSVTKVCLGQWRPPCWVGSRGIHIRLVSRVSF